jgi:hypothetical protein
MFMMSGAFSDYVGTIDKFDIAKHQYAMAEYGGGLYVGLELPFLPDGSIKDNIWEQWLDNSPFVYDPGGIYNSQGLFETNLTNIKAAGQEIYFDCGLSDELSLNYHADAAHAILNSLSYDHEYQSFDGHHSDIIGERLAISLPWISDKFPK